MSVASHLGGETKSSQARFPYLTQNKASGSWSYKSLFKLWIPYLESIYTTLWSKFYMNRVRKRKCLVSNIYSKKFYEIYNCFNACLLYNGPILSSILQLVEHFLLPVKLMSFELRTSGIRNVLHWLERQEPLGPRSTNLATTTANDSILIKG